MCRCLPLHFGVRATLRALALFAILQLSPCFAAEIVPNLTAPPAPQPTTEEILEAQTQVAHRGVLRGYSAWAPEWLMTQALREANAQKKGLESLQIFAAYFDKEDNAFLSDRILRWIEEEAPRFREKFVQKKDGPQIPIYLTIVNDLFDANGKTSFKNPDLVTRLLATPESRGAHIASLLTLVAKGTFDGLDIDYERVKKEDWTTFLQFCQDLNGEIEKQGKYLRVVLEPKKEYYAEPFPEGPEYVIMAYNLFGFHSGPGPKANPELIKRIATWSEGMTPRPRLAFASGGFLWDTEKAEKDPDRIRQLTEMEARLLAQKEGIEPQRDKDSHYLVFQFPEKAKKPKVVWYADGETLAFLAKTAKEYGFSDFALWCFAGNRRFSLDTWRTEVTE